MTDIERDSKTENTEAESGSEERKRKLDKYGLYIIILLLFFVAAIVVGLFGSALAMRRYLKI